MDGEIKGRERERGREGWKAVELDEEVDASPGVNC